MNLQNRVEKLEQAAAGGRDGQGCELCARVETLLIMPEVDGERWEETDHTSMAVNCPKCNALREIVVRVIMPRPPEM
jgi:hypothetical protein